MKMIFALLLTVGLTTSCGHMYGSKKSGCGDCKQCSTKQCDVSKDGKKGCACEAGKKS
jgi:hypothetical protein